MLTISGNFDSANPQQDGIIKRDKNSFVLHAFSETSVEAFKFDTTISNSSSENQRINLKIIWPTNPFSELRDCFYWQHEKYDTLPLLAEIPWFGRNAATMRLTGKRLLKAFIMMNTINSSTNWGNI